MGEAAGKGVNAGERQGVGGDIIPRRGAVHGHSLVLSGLDGLDSDSESSDSEFKDAGMCEVGREHVYFV